MTRDILSLLDYEAQRQPEIADLVARIDLLSEADLRVAPVKLPWMRQALLMLKRDRARTVLAASLEQWVVDGHAPDPEGEMRRWEGADTFIQVGRTALEICYGQLVWFGQSGVWIDTICATVIDPQLARNTVSCGRVRRSAYMTAVRSRMKQLCPAMAATQPMEQVRFFRPG
jgi:hypothetical protein